MCGNIFNELIQIRMVLPDACELRQTMAIPVSTVGLLDRGLSRGIWFRLRLIFRHDPPPLGQDGESY